MGTQRQTVVHSDPGLNASIWHGPTVRALRCALFEEHLRRDTSGLDDVAALDLFARAACENMRLRRSGEPQRSLALALDPATYAS